MSSTLPDRFRAEIRLGHDGIAETWLATDTALDRPVLVRLLKTSVSRPHRRSFLDGVRAAAGINHSHIAEVYAADESEDGAYAVTEWAGGVTIADRIEAGEPIAVEDFLPNAAGLADALAALHERGVIHGAVGPETILYSAAHPAKLAGFGINDNGTASADTMALAQALRVGLAGAPTDLSPSQIAAGLSPSVDDAIRRAQAGALDAAGLAAALRAAPSVQRRRPKAAWSWRWVVPAALLIAAAVGVVGLGFAVDVQDDSPFLFPAGAPPPETTQAPSAGVQPTAPTVTSITPGGVGVLSVDAYDPFGDQSEHGDDAAFAVDGDAETGWRTEQYFDPLGLIKPGVGLAFEVQGAPGVVALTGSTGTTYRMLWAAGLPEDFEVWEPIASGTFGPGPASHQLPEHTGGVWLLWLTDLPLTPENVYYAEVHEVRFSA